MGTLLNRRRYMGGGGETIPYQQIEYLETTGTQYIDTLIPLNNSVNLGIYVDVTTGTISSEQAIVGNNGPSYNELYFTSSKIGFFNKSGTSVSVNTTTSNANFIINVQMTSSSMYIDVNGTTSSYAGSTLPQSNRRIVLFRHNSNYYFKGKICAIKLWIEGSLVADLIPVRIGQVGYMYDKVSGQLFGNAGTGNFLLGNDK